MGNAITDPTVDEECALADTPEKALRLVLDFEGYFGYDPYYAEIRRAVLEQVEKVLTSCSSAPALPTG